MRIPSGGMTAMTSSTVGIETVVPLARVPPCVSASHDLPGRGVEFPDATGAALLARAAGVTSLPAGLAARLIELLPLPAAAGLCARVPAGVLVPDIFPRDRLIVSVSLPEPLRIDAPRESGARPPSLLAAVFFLYADSFPLAPETSASAARWMPLCSLAFLRVDSLPLASERFGEPGRFIPPLRFFFLSDGVFAPLVEAPEPLRFAASPAFTSFFS